MEVTRGFPLFYPALEGLQVHVLCSSHGQGRLVVCSRELTSPKTTGHHTGLLQCQVPWPPKVSPFRGSSWSLQSLQIV
jgi:hypothetical protein